MKSLIHAGQHNLRGKRAKLLRCGCCCVQDFRPKETKKMVKNEITEFRKYGFIELDSIPR